eukprot:8181-Heterococcus_DN1.PRE.2
MLGIHDKSIVYEYATYSTQLATSRIFAQVSGASCMPFEHRLTVYTVYVSAMVQAYHNSRSNQPELL